MNLIDALDFWAARWPDRTAVRCSGQDHSWAWLRERSGWIAAGLLQSGLRPGDRVGILMHNRIEFVETMLGALRAGVVVTLLNVRLTAREMCHPVKDAGLRLIVTEARLAALLDEARAQVPYLAIHSVDGAMDGVAPFNQLRVASAAPARALGGTDDVALVCYTSGTTGFPKGAMLTHGNLWQGALSTNLPAGLTHEDRLLVSLPLAYTWGSCCFLREGIVPGATTTIIDPTGDAEVLIDVLERDRIGVWSTPPVLFERIAASPRFAHADFTSLRHVVTGGPSLHLLNLWQAKGVRLVQAYGMTETAGHVTLLFPEDATRKRGSSGRPLLNVALKICDEDGHECPVGTAGEIMVRAPCVMKGYINNPAETARAIVDGWLHTGDMGLLDDEGHLIVVDRLKDMLKSGGLCVYPAEIERALAGIRGLEEFAVIGVPDERWGEVPMIVAHGEAEIDLDDLLSRCALELAGYKQPRYVVRHPQKLPRTVSGKVVKKELRAAYPSPPAHAQRLRP